MPPREVSTFSELKNAIDVEIPVLNEISRLRGLYEAAKSKREGIDPISYGAPQLISGKIPGYGRFWEAQEGHYLLDTPIPEMWYGIQIIPGRNTTKYRIVFALEGKIKGLIAESDNLVWIKKITPANFYYDTDTEGGDYDFDLDDIKYGNTSYTITSGGIYYFAIDSETKKVDETKVVLQSSTIDLSSVNSLPDTKVPTAFWRLYDAISIQYLYTAKDTNPKYEEAVTAEENALLNLNKEIAKLPEGVGEYNTINLSSSFKITDIDYPTDDKNYFLKKWPTGYTLDGNKISITNLVKNGRTYSLFDENLGTIRYLATPTGHIANDNSNGKARLCLTYWGGNYRLYNNEGDYTQKADLEELLYEERSTPNFPFGYDCGVKEVQPAASSNKLYKAKYTYRDSESQKKEVLDFYLNIQDNNIVYDKTKSSFEDISGKDKIVNTILYMQDSDANLDQQNIAFKQSNSSYFCNKTVLAEGNGISEFYIPFSFYTRNVIYNRDFKGKEYASVCLPFAITPTIKEKVGIANTFQFSSIDEDTKTMWFTKYNSTAANKPYIVSFNKPSTEETSDKDERFIIQLEDEMPAISFLQTPTDATTGKTNLVTTVAGEGDFCGNYAYTYVTNLIGNEQYSVYGVLNDKLIRANATDKLSHFRAYVYSPTISTTAGAPSFKIGLMDEDGNELSTAIETVSGEIISGFKAKGGDNAIEIITDKACQVKVYALNGALVKSARVEAGVTSLPVKSGMYVVNGAKVIVK